MSNPTIAEPDTIEKTELDRAFEDLTGFREQEDDGSEKDRFSHYVRKDDIVASAMTGVPTTALCGKQWTPKANPEKYPVCPECKDKLEQLPEG